MLWEYEVAEFFIRPPDQEHYFEFNLAPNGAWWSCDFERVRHAIPGQPAPVPNVVTETEIASDSWKGAARIPRDYLEKRYNLSQKPLVNVTFILRSPEVTHWSASYLGGGEPDFHRPEHFSKTEFRSLA